MSIGWSGLGGALTQGPLDIYKMMLEQRFRQQQAQQSQEMDYQDWMRRQLFLQGVQGPERAKQQAQQQLQTFLAAYPNWQSDPALVSHYQQLTTAAGFPTPTRQTTAGAPTVGIPGQAMAEGGLSQFLRPQGTQQIPSGQTRAEPILPQLPSQQLQTVAVVNRATGGVQYLQVPAGARIEAYTPPSGPSQSVLVDPTTGKVIQRFPPGVTVHVAPREPSADPNQLTPTERTLLDTWLDPAKRQALGGQGTQDALWLRVRAALRRIGVAAPDAPPPDQSDFWAPLKRWLGSLVGNGQPGNVTTGVPQPQPAIGTPPVSPGVPRPPARAVGAPPVAPQKTITQAQVAAIAKKRGVSLAEAIRQARAQGYTVTP